MLTEVEDHWEGMVSWLGRPLGARLGSYLALASTSAVCVLMSWVDPAGNSLCCRLEVFSPWAGQALCVLAQNF